MSHIYIVYRDFLQADGYVTVLGNYLGYNVGKIDKAYVDNRIYITKLNPLVIREELALAWKFADSYDGKLTIKPNTTVAAQMFGFLNESQINELENKGKVKYILSEKDLELGTEFHKLILYKIIEDRFSEKYLELCHYSSALEKASWSAQLYEASRPSNEPKPVLELLAKNKNISLQEMVDKVNSKIQNYNLSVGELLSEEQKLKAEVKRCKNLADCHRLRHLKFGVSMSIKQMEGENIETSPATLKITF